MWDINNRSTNEGIRERWVSLGPKAIYPAHMPRVECQRVSYFYVMSDSVLRIDVFVKLNTGFLQGRGSNFLPTNNRAITSQFNLTASSTD